MGSYQKAIASFSAEEAVSIEAALVRWATEDDMGREIVKNINPLERFLPKDDMREILDIIRQSSNDPLPVLKKRYDRECHRHVLLGGPVKCPKPVLIGRAVQRDYFVLWLYREHGAYFHNERMAQDFVARLRRGDSLSDYESSILMSAWSAWVTWDEKSADADPFGFMESENAEEVKGSLGLDPERRWDGKPLLLLVYHRLQNVELYRPTVADAGLHRFFEPPPIGHDSHGWTKTWPPGMQSSKLRLKPRPEALHRPVPMRCIAQPLRELK
jgi:hypothetical protein